LKYKDLKSEDMLLVDAQVESSSNFIDFKMRGSGLVAEQYGICATCKHFTYAATKYRTVRALCILIRSHPQALSDADIIEECTSHTKRGQMELYDMVQMAVLIESNPSRKAGFNSEDLS